MPDPIINGHYRAMWIWQHPSGLPEDRFVNTWFFRDDNITGDHETIHGNIEAVLAAFYTSSTTAGNRISAFMPSSHVATAELRTYHLGEETPRTPFISAPGIAELATGAALPAEVAGVMSYRTTRKGPRGRGRIFLGPLATSVLEQVDGWARPSLIFRNCVQDRAANVLATNQNVTWVGLSRMDQLTYEVTGGYCDNAFDTMRKRGPGPTLRNAFGDYVLAA